MRGAPYGQQALQQFRQAGLKPSVRNKRQALACQASMYVHPLNPHKAV
jgi:hypothetical protein